MRSLMYSIRKTGARLVIMYGWTTTRTESRMIIEYAVPEGTAETGFSRLLPKRKAARKDAATGNLVYDPDWGDGLPDPGINGVKVELLDENGLPCNYNGEAVGEKRADGKYPRLNPDGKPMYDASTGEVLSGYGPLSTVTKSDYYGNQGYDMLPESVARQLPLTFHHAGGVQ